MELWLDTIETAAIEKAHELEILDGITTNPSILSQAKESHDKVIEHLLNIQESPIAIQLTSANPFEEGMALYRYSPRIIVKVPATQENYLAMRQLTDAGVRVMATAIYEPQQAYLALKLGVEYAAFYYGKILEGGKDPLELLRTVQAFKKNEGFDGKLLAAGIRSVDQFNQIALQGCDAITLPARIFNELISTPSAVKKILQEFPANDFFLTSLAP